jgi:ABC-type glycerol-3-phosphate transport system permease component
MSAVVAQPRRLRVTMKLWAKLILLTVLLLWMIPEIYMVSVALRSPDAAFAPQIP